MPVLGFDLNRAILPAPPDLVLAELSGFNDEHGVEAVGEMLFEAGQTAQVGVGHRVGQHSLGQCLLRRRGVVAPPGQTVSNSY